MSRRPSPRVLFVAAAGTSAAGCAAALAASPILGAGFGAVSTVLVLGGLLADRGLGFSGRKALVRRVAERAEAGRRMAMYEPESGLLAYWYLTLRGTEECERASRYERALTLLLVEATPEVATWVGQGRLVDWLKRGLRAVDITGDLGNGRFAALMPETDVADARHVAARLQRDVGGVRTSLSTLGVDGITFDELYAAASQRLHEPLQAAA